ncbi:MAG: hypothetical protein IKA03_03180, partial [Alphaproteobacteria bacterium]|nr:hypothetical protein [Alphaproteobacteria bacterium]
DVVNGKLGKEILEVINKALKKPIDKDLKKTEKERYVNIPNGVQALLEVLRLILKIVSEQNDVVDFLIADEQNLRDIACGNNDKTNPALIGWRYDVFGKYALAFRKGKSSLTYDTLEKKIIFS